jgi:hypothetical protein
VEYRTVTDQSAAMPDILAVGETTIAPAKIGIVSTAAMHTPLPSWVKSGALASRAMFSFGRLRTLVRASIRWSSRPTLLSAAFDDLACSFKVRDAKLRPGA